MLTDEDLTNLSNTLKPMFNSIKPKGVSQVVNLVMNPRLYQVFNVSLPTSVTTLNAALTGTPAATFQVQAYGAFLYPPAMNVDSNTQSNFTFFMQADGITLDSNTTFVFPVSLGYNPIPEGTAIRLYPNATVKIFAYYTGTSGTAGKLSVSALIDEILSDPNTVNKP
jgi:hypothetical protein